MAQSGSQEGPILSGVAARYASALFDLAREQNAVDQVARDLDQFDALVAQSPDLVRLLRNPIFTEEEQTRSIDAILTRAGVSGLTGNFIRLVAAKRRLFALQDMIRAFRELSSDAKGIVRVQVTLAEPASDRVMNEITAALREVAKAEVAVSVKIDPSLIGGVVIRVGDIVYDGSVRNQLSVLRERLERSAQVMTN